MLSTQIRGELADHLDSAERDRAPISPLIATYPDIDVVDAYIGSSGVLTGSARAAQNALAKALGHPVVVDNQPGAGGIVGLQALPNNAATAAAPTPYSSSNIQPITQAMNSPKAT